jgi:hypothetical protein
MGFTYAILFGLTYFITFGKAGGAARFASLTGLALILITEFNVKLSGFDFAQGVLPMAPPYEKIVLLHRLYVLYQPLLFYRSAD